MGRPLDHPPTLAFVLQYIKYCIDAYRIGDTFFFNAGDFVMFGWSKLK